MRKCAHSRKLDADVRGIDEAERENSMNLGVFGDSRADLVSPFVAVSIDVSDITLGEQAVNTFLESKQKAGVSLTKDVLVKWVSDSERQQRGSIN